MNKKTTVLAIGRWMPIHIGHKNFLTELARNYDRLIVGIGSCYENGTPRNCIPAIEREKLLRKIFKAEKLNNITIIPVEDRPTFKEWFDDVVNICKKFKVTHFCTGNKEDILNVMKENGLSLDAELIDPEQTSDFPYHATDIRNAILRGEIEKLDHMIPAEIKNDVLGQVAKEIRMASEGRGQQFIPGRQTVDVVFIINDIEKQKKFLLIGKRNASKIDFPNCYAIPGCGILDFESPINAAQRSLELETGIKITIDDNSCEPAKITLDSLDNKSGHMYFTGIYASPDERINGTRGGGSQCFAILTDESRERIESILHSEHDLEELLLVDVNDVHRIDFAYDQKRMVFDAFSRLGIACDNGECLAIYNEDKTPSDRGVSRASAHSEGILHGASHTYIYKWDNNNLMILLQRRSMNKDSYPGCLDTSSAGHVEFGSDFLVTAVKELYEELGLGVESSELEFLFEQKVCYKNLFHGQTFIDREINRIYALKKDCDTHSLKLQTTEVSEAIWMNSDDIIAAVDSGSGEICIAPDEIKRVIDILKKRHT